MIYLFDKDEKLFKIINKPALKTVLQKYALTTEQYVSDRLTVEMKSLDADELEKVEYMAIQTIEDAHTFHYFYVAQKYTEQLTTLIGVQSGIEELRKTPVWDKRPKNAFAKNVINDLLKGTNWQARFVGETTQRSTSFYYISVFEALKKVCKVWDLEMQFFVEMNGNKIGARYIDFKRKIGSAVGKRVVYGHNALQILQEVERTNLFTALIGRGKGEQVSSAEESDKKTDGYGRKITFENVVWDVAKGNPVNKPKGQRFVELPEMTKVYGIKNTDGSIRPKIGFVDFQEEEEPGVLLERTYKALVDTARPQLTLKTTSAYLRGVKVGDTIRVVRHDKKLDYDTRIFEITFNRLNDQSSDIKLGDRIGESNEAKAQTIAEKVVDDFVSNEFSNFVQNLPDFLPSADGFNNNWYGAEDPTVKHPGKVLINDIWFKPDPEHEGHKIMLRWTGEVWDEILRSYDKESLKKRISEEIANFDKAFQSVNEQNKKKINEILQSSGASSLLAQEAKRIGLDSLAKLDAFKSQATSVQTALSGDLDVLKRTIANDIRPKQAQAEAEIAKQVEALVQTKTELAGVKSAQATYEETTTRRLSELTNLANGKASKSELTQTAEELTSKIASVQIGGRNYIRGTRRMALASGLWTSGTFRLSGDGTAKTIDVSNSPATGFDKAIRLTSSNDRDQIGIAQDGFFISQGTYTITCWVKGKRGQKVKLQTYWQVNDNSGISPIFTLSDENWTRLSFTTTRDIAGTVSIGYVYLVNAEAGEYLDVLAPQLENGSLATSPKEAPEDTDGQISAVESTFKQRADSLEAGVNRLTEGLRTKADISSLNVTAENIRQSVKSLETSTQNKLDKKLSMAEFEVRASGIRQEIVNATKDKADKTLVVAEAGKLREEFSKMKVGSRNYAEDYDFSRGLWHYSQGDNSPQDWTISNGEYNVKGTTNTWKQMQIHSKEGSRSSWKSSTALLDLEVGETYTLSFQGICYSGSSSVWLSLRANRTVSGNPEIIPGTFNLTSSWQTYQVTIPALTKPDNFDFWRIILGYDGIGHVAFRKVELTRSSTRIDAGPAPEDGKTDLVVAKSEFQKTAEGLRTDLSAIQEYVNKDGQRQEALQRYTREESAKQATAVRELVAKDYVGKATYQEDVRGINQRIEEAKKNASNELTTRLANYRQTVDGKFTDISSQVTTYKQVTDEKFGNLSNQIVNNKNSTDDQIENVRNQLAKKVEVTDFQRVQETSRLYERIIGSNENDITDKVARMALTNQLFQVEVAKRLGSDNNLIVRSKSMDRHTLVNEGDTKRVFVNNGIFTIRCTGNSDYTFAGFTLPLYIDRLARGETYTLNFKYRIMGRLDHNFTVVAKNHQSNEGIFSSNIATSSTAVSSDWKEFNETYTISRDFEFGNSKLYPLYFYLAKNGWVEIKEIMLVRAIQTNGYKVSQLDDMSEAVRSVQTQLAGSWAVQNINSAGSIVSQINATNNQILIEAEKIRLKGKTLLDELMAIQGYFKRLFVGDANVGTLNSDIIRANSITADKLVMDIAMARRFVSSDIFTDTLAAKEAFINKLRSVVVTATLLEGYRGLIGGFQIGTHEKDSSVYWITGQNQFSVGMSNGSGHWSQTALWVNWGNDWGYPGDYAWYVKNNGKMYCYNTAEFWNTPVIHGNLRVTGHIYYNNENSGKTGHWIHSSKYSNFEPSDNYLYLYYSGSGYDWIPMNKEISDRRYKHNIEDSTVSGLDVIQKLKTYSYRKEYDGKIEDIACGIMAQDVQKYAPEAFFENPDGAYSYNTFALVPYLIKAIQELNHKIEKLEKTA